MTIALDALGFGMLIPVEPDLVMKIGRLPHADASVWLGVLLAAFSAMQFLASPVLGGLSDRFGRRPVLLISLGALGIGTLLTPFAPNLLWLLAIRMFAGVTSGNAAAAQAYIADVTPPEQRARRFGVVGALYGLGFVLGPALGGTLGAISLSLPFMASAGLAACNVAYGLVRLPESLPPRRRRRFAWRRANPVGAAITLLADGDAARLGLAWCCSWFALGALQSSFILANELRFHWSPLENGLVLATGGCASALTQGVLQPIVVKRIGARGAALLGLVLSGLGYGCYAFATDPLILFPGLLILALGTLANPAIQSMISASADSRRQGEAQGALSGLQGLMAIVSPLTTSWLFAAATRPGGMLRFPGAPFLLAAIICLAGAAVLRSVRPSRMAALYLEPEPE